MSHDKSVIFFGHYRNTRAIKLEIGRLPFFFSSFSRAPIFSRILSRSRDKKYKRFIKNSDLSKALKRKICVNISRYKKISKEERNISKLCRIYSYKDVSIFLTCSRNIEIY